MTQVPSFAVQRIALVALVAACVAGVSPALALNDNPHGSAFVVLYQCDGERWMPVAYPAPFAADAEPPARVSWNGSTVVMSLARSGSGSRYVNRAADLEWWIKGRNGTMYRLSDHTRLTDCREG
ncbi:MAG: MliC family protein [Betaproteobacteria bacterium]